MAIGKPDLEWQKKVKIWLASGKSVKEWCQENNVPPTTLYGWLRKYKSQYQISSNKQPFVELKDTPNDNGIVLEFQEFKIHLSVDFDAILLKRCLSALRDIIC